MRHQSQLRKDAAEPTAAEAAVHMADAIAYLMRVADEAGLVHVAARLAGIRASLLRSRFGHAEQIAFDGPKSGSEGSTLDGADHERKARKRH